MGQEGPQRLGLIGTGGDGAEDSMSHGVTFSSLDSRRALADNVGRRGHLHFTSIIFKKIFSFILLEETDTTVVYNSVVNIFFFMRY